MGNHAESFKEEFLNHYLRLGLGSMPKADIDALVMSLIDKYGVTLDIGPTMMKDNQTVSQLLKTPVAKVKKLRYDAALKYESDIESYTKGKLEFIFKKATLEASDKKIQLIIEDVLVKNWIQGQLKNSQQFYDNSFNREIIKMDISAFNSFLENVFPDRDFNDVKEHLERCLEEENAELRKSGFESAMQTLTSLIVSTTASVMANSV